MQNRVKKQFIFLSRMYSIESAILISCSPHASLFGQEVDHPSHARRKRGEEGRKQ